MSSVRKLDVQELRRDLAECYRSEDGTVSLAVYLRGYRSLLRFFRLLGRIFSFVASDVESKITILENYLNSSDGDQYETVQSMVIFEKKTGRVLHGGKKGEPSGCRTLLRLHWSIEFIIIFLGRLQELGDSEGTCHACQETYKETLAAHHPWIIQKGALMAMHTLPTAKGLVEQTCSQSIDEVRLELPHILEGGQVIYKAMQKLYEDNDLLDLP